MKMLHKKNFFTLSGDRKKKNGVFFGFLSVFFCTFAGGYNTGSSMILMLPTNKRQYANTKSSLSTIRPSGEEIL